VPCLFSSAIKKFCYASAIVNVPETVNVAILSPVGECVEVELVQGVTVNAKALGALTTTIPDPPAPPATVPGEGPP
jgi:hypothetical protein